VRAITDKQRAVLAYIVEFRGANGYSPSIRDIGKEFGVSSTNGVNDHIKALVRKGYLRRDRYIARSLIPIERDPFHDVPALADPQEAAR
jgi:repressor LexA